MFLLQFGLDVDNTEVEQTRRDDGEGRKAAATPADQYNGAVLARLYPWIDKAVSRPMIDIEVGTSILTYGGRVETGPVAWRRIGYGPGHLLYRRCQIDGYDQGFIALWYAP